MLKISTHNLLIFTNILLNAVFKEISFGNELIKNLLMKFSLYDEIFYFQD